MSFNEIFDQYDWEEAKASIIAKTPRDVENALLAEKRTPEHFKALISPAAQSYLEYMARLSHSLTRKRFGNTIQLFAPLYLSNECNNICTYCGFSFDNKIKRKTLSASEILLEINELKNHGFQHILLVTGEAGHTVNIDYFLKAVELIRPHFANISLEVQPLEHDEYHLLHQCGIHSVLVYQETYNKQQYNTWHTKGKKANFNYRLQTPDRIGKAGMHKIGLGVLLGLDDWRTDSFFCALHLHYLQKTYWQTRYSVSLPRIRPAEGLVQTGNSITDAELVQLICAYRLFKEDLDISMSTRETETFRNNIIKLGTTTISAGSKTNPGGYIVDPQSLEQFEISDERSPEQMAALISSLGYTPVWKDWDKHLQS
ncbi:2-iminoacetate synthase ThiH [Flavihumibacter sp. ZG627]|uniref:2-iminoacetate synthase ThiH n=1 Tax=Flavihumibacter sp. ZG627 TaxID=1463156 RepID=UPI00057E6E7D|nr:2-iminoacetate synthase ThiH [Flavihumibacter sp. ZG627]KIC92086.1 thiamine biosynthesis protein ThiH [Flavihumibacter sp. ZG627]